MIQSEQSTILAALVACLGFALTLAGALYAYNEGYLDPCIQKIGVYLFKAKAMAEKKKLQAQGQKAGRDFVDSKNDCIARWLLLFSAQLDGAQQADQVKAGLGSVGGLKKNL
ncbi:hypothetical protein RB597_002527 [Gaeumannomyces tritici]